MPAPNTPTDLIDRLRTLERRIDELSGRVNIRPALNTIVGGSVTVKGGGTLVVQDSDGTNVFTIGNMAPDVDGQPQQATLIRRMDGSLAFAVWTSATTGAQKVIICDKGSNAIFADDVNSAGGGLALPWIPMTLPVTNTSSQWPSTTAVTMTEVAMSKPWFHHPKVYIYAVCATTGGTGQIQVTIGGAVVATSPLGTNPSIDGVFDVPAWAWTGVPQQKTVSLLAMRGTATSVAATVRTMYGRQS